MQGSHQEKNKNFPTHSREFGAQKTTGEMMKTPNTVGQLGSMIENIQRFNNKVLVTSLTTLFG
jgi:hypothetical protein